MKLMSSLQTNVNKKRARHFLKRFSQVYFFSTPLELNTVTRTLTNKMHLLILAQVVQQHLRLSVHSCG